MTCRSTRMLVVLGLGLIGGAGTGSVLGLTLLACAPKKPQSAMPTPIAARVVTQRYRVTCARTSDTAWLCTTGETERRKGNAAK